ncbi:MAG: hypothetical protein KDA27_17995 [Candidatus Eisenbacteria bacterium]|uniref:Uncharacterized protein n=1 Tax=Eiseniibacteriota bacterium TaxID=2212470 RepID=A0A956NH04_UNCEI|nr:hypothetical protein [Candidatus Eisenbacteria bacterium]MCB9464195.1 hypothetical protein [Candidatus Eisenbacteria bacterium]
MTDWTILWPSASQAAVSAADTIPTDLSSRLDPIIDAREPRFRALLLAWADRALDEETIEAEFEDERYVLESELLAVDGMPMDVATSAAAAVLDVIEAGLREGIAL